LISPFGPSCPFGVGRFGGAERDVHQVLEDGDRQVAALPAGPVDCLRSVDLALDRCLALAALRSSSLLKRPKRNIRIAIGELLGNFTPAECALLQKLTLCVNPKIVTL
jgi:hypothetical protein